MGFIRRNVIIIFSTLSVEVIETSKNNAPYFLAVSSPSSTVTCLSPWWLLHTRRIVKSSAYCRVRNYFIDIFWWLTFSVRSLSLLTEERKDDRLVSSYTQRTIFFPWVYDIERSKEEALPGVSQRCNFIDSPWKLKSKISKSNPFVGRSE